MSKDRRLFFALWPQAEVREALRGIQQDNTGHHGRLVHPEDFHLTLSFLGAVDDAARACCERAAARLSAEPFRITLDLTGLWSRSRIFWCGASRVPQPLRDLQADLAQTLRPCGFEPESRPFKAHVTLARDVSPLPTGPVEPVDWFCDRFVLAESLPLPRPPRYRVVHEWPLEAQSPGSGP